MTELDTEWMKFMTRISRQQNCDNADESSEGEDECSDAAHIGRATTTQFGIVSIQPSSIAPVTISPKLSAKKSCISKKAQRRTYSFLDTSTDIAGVSSPSAS